METINRTKKVIVLLLMLVGFAPSASVTLTTTKAAVAANQAATDDEVEAMKEDLRRILEDFMRMSSEAYGELHENATEDEAPELYQDFEELQRLLMDMYERVYYATTMEELNALERMFRDYVVERFDAFYSQIISLYEFSAATVEGIVLKYRIIEKEKTAKVKGIGDHDANCTVTIPETVNGYTVNEIADYAFQYARIGTVVMPETIKTIGEFSFDGCSRLLSLSIPNSVTTIIRYAFAGCTSLASVTIPKFVTSIGECAFEECPGLTSISVEPGNTTYDSRNNCNAIIETASNTLITGCKNTIIPNTVTSIGAYSFMRNSLTSITIPSSVTKIGFYAFYQCWSLTSVTVKMKTPVEVEGGVSTFFNSNNATLYVPKGCKAAYESADIWKDFKTIEELPEPEIAVSFDVNGDGEVNSADITCLVNRITGITSCPNDHHPHLIDLGLPSGTKWACCNLDATTPEGYGGYYRWGETSPLALGEMPIDYPYNSLDLNISGTQYDAATASWGAPWQMPTKEQIQELLDNSTNTWAVQDGVNGRKFTGTNGGTLFLPAAGSVWNGGLGGVGSNGSYWSSTPPTIKGYALSQEIDSDGVKWLATGRLAGLSVRPVQIANSPEESLSSPYDVNQDGKVNIADVTFLIDRIAYLERLKTLESGSAEEVRTVLEEMPGVNQADAGEVANTLQENANVIEAFTEDGNNVVVRQDEEEGYRVYPMYHLESLFSDDVLTSEVETAMARSSQRRTVHYDQKIAIFNYFGSASATSIYYPTQNWIMSCLTAWFNNHGYTTEVYGDSPQKPFTVENLQKVVDEWVNYKAIIIMTHGAVVENKTPFFAVHELIEKKRDNGFVDPDDKKVYKIVSVEDMFKKVGRGCYIYLGACDGAPKGGYQHIDDLRFPMLSNTDIIGWSGKTRIAQAHAALLFHSLLYGGYTWGQVWQGITSQDGTAQAHPSYHMQESVSPFTFAGNDDIKTEYDNSVSASVFVNQVKDKDMVDFKITVEGFDYPCEIKGNIVNLINGTKIAWNKKIYNSSYNSFNKQLPLSALADGIYSLEILAHPDDQTDGRRVKFNMPACFIKSKYFKELAATLVAEADVAVPVVLDSEGVEVDEVTLPARTSQTFSIDGYSGHSFKGVCLHTAIATATVTDATLAVSGVSEGSTYIGVYDEQNHQMAVVKVSVGPGSVACLTCPDANHPHWIDLGLSSGTQWRCCNEGASTPEAYGGYYTFGQVSSAPTFEQIGELLWNTTSVWTTLNGVNGRKFTGINGGTIFLPAAGCSWECSSEGEVCFDGVGYRGEYGSSTPNDEYYVYGLYFRPDDADWSGLEVRDLGHSVRPVR